MSAELKGAGPEAYNEKYLDDLIVFEAPGTEANGLVGRWLVRPILRGVHRVFQRAKVRNFLFTFILACVWLCKSMLLIANYF